MKNEEFVQRSVQITGEYKELLKECFYCGSKIDENSYIVDLCIKCGITNGNNHVGLGVINKYETIMVWK